LLDIGFQSYFSVNRPSIIVAGLLALLIGLHPGVGNGQATFYQIDQENLRLIYSSRLQRYVLPHISGRFQSALDKHRTLLGFEPSEQTTLLLLDIRDQGNASAAGVPRNIIVAALSPFRYTYETVPSGERIGWLMSHELVHVAASDMSTSRDRFFRSIFRGKVFPTPEHPLALLYAYGTSPRVFSPRWYHEGAAVFMETWMNGGLGRGLGAYDEMMFRTLVLEDAKMYDFVSLESEGTSVDFQVGTNSYMYGTRFMSYLAREYSPDSVAAWIGRRPNTKAYFASEFRRLFGKSLRDGWNDWLAFERSFQAENLERIRANPVTKHRDLVDAAVGSVSRAFYDSLRGEVYAAVRTPGHLARIVALDPDRRQVRRITEVKGAALFYVTSLAYDSETGTLFFTTDNSSRRDIRSVDVETGDTRMLLKDERIGDLAFNRADRSLWGVRHFNGISTVVRIPHPYVEWDQVLSLPFGRDIYDLDISPSGKLLTASFVEYDGQQRLVSFEVDSLLSGSSRYTTLFDFNRSNPESFVFSNDGRFLHGSSYYSGVSNLFRYDLEARDMVALTNAETGYFRPVQISEDSVFAFRYSNEGFVPVTLANRSVDRVGAITFLGQSVIERHPSLADWMLPASPIISGDSLRAAESVYRPIRDVSLRSVYPIIQGYKDFAAVGLRAELSDPLRLNEITLDVSYSPNTDSLELKERFHVDLRYETIQWYGRATYNRANFFDLFGPTKTSRKGFSLGVGRRGWLIYDIPSRRWTRTLSYDVELIGYAGLDRLPNAQNIGVTYEDLLTGEATLEYRNVRSSLGAVDDEKGFEWRVTPSVNYASREAWPLLHGELNLGIALPIGHSSIWLRTAAGISTNQPDEPFAKFYFGGFGNNYVDYKAEKRYREYYAFPGAELNAISGTSFAKAMAEWTLPPVRFSRIGISSLFLQWARLAAFSSAISTNLYGDGDKRNVINVGGQLDVRFVLLTYFPITVSTGYAYARDLEDGRDGTEVMFSVRIMGWD
jgi:hypothetical protein